MIWLETYRTLDEALFIRDLAIRNPAALAKYAVIVRGGMRRWDEGIDIWVVLRVLDEVTGLGTFRVEND